MTNLLEELQAADEQGERAISSLWPGDRFYYKKRFWEVLRLQWHNDRQRLYVTTTQPEGDPYPLPMLHGEGVQMFQPLKTFLLYGLSLFPSMLTDEHFSEEHPETQPGW